MNGRLYQRARTEMEVRGEGQMQATRRYARQGMSILSGLRSGEDGRPKAGSLVAGAHPELAVKQNAKERPEIAQLSQAVSGSSMRDSWRTTTTMPETVTWKRRRSDSAS